MVKGSEFSLANCDQEPIHIPGSIQPHGLLLGLSEPTFTVCVASDNVEKMLGRSLRQVLGNSVGELLDGPSFGLVQSALSLRDPLTRGPLRLDVLGTQFDGLIHRSQGLALLELEPHVPTPDLSAQLTQLLSRIIPELRAVHKLEQLAQLACVRMRELSGFDRCMVYRFDAHQNGQVLGEARRPDLESYLGLHYPAADIPPQARRLYRENTLRQLVDVRYAPSQLHPAINAETGEPVDLSHAILRSVSPFHRDYLQNMGVTATLAVSLMVDGELWGLLVCHHYSQRRCPPEQRAACEVLGSFLAQRIGEEQKTDERRRLESVRRVTHRLSAAGGSERRGLLEASLSDVLATLQASAIIVKDDDEDVVVGNDIPAGMVDALFAKLDELDVNDQFECDRLSDMGGSVAALAPEYAGLLAARIANDNKWVVALRAEYVHEVTWGSAKEKRFEVQDGIPRLSPEGSFGLWRETVRGRCRPWATNDRAVLTELQHALRSQEASRLTELAQRTRELQQLTEAKDDFLAQLSHELRNPLNAILGWAELLHSDQDKLDSQNRRGVDVIMRNARVQARLIDDLLDVANIVRGSMRLDLNPQAVDRVLRAALESVESAAIAKNVRIKTVTNGRLPPVNADGVRLQQVIWNLLSNAVKFTPKGGTVEVSLAELNSSIVITVENEGPQIEPDLLPRLFDRFMQGRQGLKSRVGLGLGLAIAKGIVELHGGHIMAENRQNGVRFVVNLPVLALREEPPASKEASVELEPVPFDHSLLEGNVIVVVEDEEEALDVLTRVLERYGATVRGFSDPETLLTHPMSNVDLLISDLGLPKVHGLDLMRKLRADGFDAPAIALTAYASKRHQLTCLRAGFNLHLAKPIDQEQLLVSAGSLLGRFS